MLAVVSLKSNLLDITAVTWFYLRFLKKPVDESIRKEKEGVFKQMIALFLQIGFTWFEKKMKPTIGLTLIVVAEKNT